jgi:2-oxoglutarate ferredoxin oxidoreductase subunit alpha
MLRNVDTVIVPELNQGQLIHEVERLTKEKSDGGLIPINKVSSELITPNEILNKIKEVC